MKNSEESVMSNPRYFWKYATDLMFTWMLTPERQRVGNKRRDGWAAANHYLSVYESSYYQIRKFEFSNNDLIDVDNYLVA